MIGSFSALKAVSPPYINLGPNVSWNGKEGNKCFIQATHRSESGSLN